MRTPDSIQTEQPLDTAAELIAMAREEIASNKPPERVVTDFLSRGTAYLGFEDAPAGVANKKGPSLCR